MRYETQNNVDPGNCWQTAVACIFDLDPNELPPQVELVEGKWKWVDRWQNHLNAFLHKHHGLQYRALHETEISGLLRIYGHHPYGVYLWEGETVRTDSRRNEHVVVARGDKMIWDPHPSQAGLTKVKRWGIFCPPSPDIKEHWDKLITGGDKDLTCRCATCAKEKGGDPTLQSPPTATPMSVAG